MKKQNKSFISDEIDEFGSIAWFVESDDWLEGKMNCKHQKSAGLRITDCYKVISLEFDYKGHNQYKSRLAKVDRIIEELESFRQAITESWGEK